jgi:hypothetical protein
MNIEFCGQPGVGKSYLVSKIAGDLNYQMVGPLPWLKLIPINILFFILHPIIFTKDLSFFIFSSDSKQLKYLKFVNLFLQRNAKYLVSKINKNCLIDQGVFHSMIARSEIEMQNLSTKGMVNYKLFPDLLVLVVASPAIIKQRLDKRGYTSRENLGRDYSEKWLNLLSKNFDFLAKNVDKIGVNYLIIENSDTNGYNVLVNYLNNAKFN